MKFYRINYGDCEGFKARNSEQVIEWVTSRRVAERVARGNDDGDYRSVIIEVSVPTDKSGLLEFLNRYAAGY